MQTAERSVWGPFLNHVTPDRLHEEDHVRKKYVKWLYLLHGELKELDSKIPFPNVVIVCARGDMTT